MEQQKFILMTDSASDLSAGLVEQYDLAVIPLQMTINGKTYNNYPDEREIKNRDFYKMLREGGRPTTSAVNVGDFHHFMEGYLAQGLDILYLGFSSALSSTVEAAKIAAAELCEKFPGRTVRVIDTLCASLGEGMLVYLAAKKRQEGAGLEEVAEFAEGMKLSICHWFTVDDRPMLVTFFRSGSSIRDLAFMKHCFGSSVSPADRAILSTPSQPLNCPPVAASSVVTLSAIVIEVSFLHP